MIKKVTIENFRGIEKLEFVPGKLNVLAGPNGSGKSSVVRAILFALTGKAGPEDIRRGASKASVTLVLDHDELQRTRGPKGTVVSINGKRATAAAAGALLESYGIQGDAADALDADFFDGLSKKDLSETLASMLPMKMSFDGFLEAVRAVNGKAPLTPAQEAICREILPAGEFGMDDLQAAYRDAYDRRAAQKKVAAALRTQSQWTGPVPERDEMALRQETAELNALMSSMGAYEQKKMAFDENQRAIAKAKARAEQLDAQLASMPEVPVPDQGAMQKAQAEKDRFLQAKAQRMGAGLQGEKTVAAQEANITFLEKTLAGLSGTRCPLSDRLVCGTDKGPLRAELEAQIAQMKGQVAVQKQTLLENSQKVALYDQQIAKRDAVIAAYMQNIAAYNARLALVRERASIQFPAPMQAPEPPACTRDQLQAKQAQLSREYALLGAYAQAEKARGQLQAEVLKLDALEALVPLLDARNGIRAYVLGKALAGLRDKAMEKAEAFKPGYGIRFAVDDGIRVYVRPGQGKAEVALEELSAGERLFAGYLLASCAASVTGSGLLFIDGFERLDEESQRAFAELLRKDPGTAAAFVGTAGSADFAGFGELIAL